MTAQRPQPVWRSCPCGAHYDMADDHDAFEAGEHARSCSLGAELVAAEAQLQ